MDLLPPGPAPRPAKRKRLTLEERKQRCRERNRMHARRTREKKKYEYTVLQQRVSALHEEGTRLRQMVDEHYTAMSLLDLGRDSEHGTRVELKQSAALCGDAYQEVMVQSLSNIDENTVPLPGSRRYGKYSAQERISMRRARNRMHAKRTRDRKKAFFDVCEEGIHLMEGENITLREYLVVVGAMTSEQAQESVQRESSSKDEAERILKGGYRYSGDAKHDSTGGRRQSKRVRSSHREDEDDNDDNDDDSTNDRDDSENDDDDDDDLEVADDHGREHGNRKRRSSESSTVSESELYTTLPRIAPRTSATSASTASSTVSTASSIVEARAPPHPALVSKLPAVPYTAACLPPPPPQAYEYAAYPAFMTFGVARPYDRRIPASALAAGTIAYFPSPLVYASAPTQYSPYPLIPY